MRVAHMLFVFPLLLGSAAACEMPPPAPVGQQFFANSGRGGIGFPIYRAGVKSLREQRYDAIVPQRLDFSCGAAALATLLAYYYDDPVPEEEIIVAMLQTGNVDHIRRYGFSLLDIKTYADSLGYETKGFQIGPEMLEQLAIPAITLVRTLSYSHFVVIKGARDGVVYLADPALGHRAMRQSAFEQEWAGVVLFVAKKRPPGAESPLDRLEALPRGPKSLVRVLDQQGLQNITFSNLEF